MPQLLSQKPIGLIIIDSIGAIFRLDTNAIARAYDMRRLVLGLQKICDDYGCGVVCVNQVSRKKHSRIFE